MKGERPITVADAERYLDFLEMISAGALCGDLRWMLLSGSEAEGFTVDGETVEPIRGFGWRAIAAKSWVAEDYPEALAEWEQADRRYATYRLHAGDLHVLSCVRADQDELRAHFDEFDGKVDPGAPGPLWRSRTEQFAEFTFARALRAWEADDDSVFLDAAVDRAAGVLAHVVEQQAKLRSGALPLTEA